MKFVYGSPKDENVDIGNDFKKIDDYDMKVHLIKGIVLGLMLTFLLSELFDMIIYKGELEFRIYKKIYLLLVLIPIHEFIHILFFPNINNTTVGLMLKNLSFYVHTNDEISKVRFLVISIAPFFLLSIIPFLYLLYSFNHLVFYFMIYNTLASGVDLVSFVFILRRPNGASYKLYRSDIYMKVENNI